MRKFLVLLLVVIPFYALAFDVPARPNSFVSDYAGMLTSEQVLALETKITAFEKNTTNEIAVVAIPSLDGDAIENVAQDIFTRWGIGKKDKSNGVLLLVSLADRQTRIHTGYGVEGDLTDLGTHYIQDEVMAPAFQAGDYYSGINGAVDKIIAALSGSVIVPADYQNSPRSSGFLAQIPGQFFVFLAIVIFQILASILGRSKAWWHGGVLGGGVALLIWHFFIASIFTAIPVAVLFIGLGLLFDFLVSRAYPHGKTGGRGPWWFGGGGFGGGGGGGFGGFGGGFSGGGGSSGRW
ncbi:hypothetical protein A3I95_01380 [Candidatus Nomurabacteria bacterium RIFCSPLOWO2_02_FULL_44_12]|nr:MAG: hypothetical protein A3E95_01195 [Candidatus Nomurabacteria bacterium RIFCSPHIGHO2_12_FULL_44_22b]OGJ08345.1 MAG: hypothetical protein A3I95_01380 [Candidatus Nomurabacteria bacterium RIFCSPLOWO2_02_FULL_44_12]